ncbi:methylaspartate mutase subunit E [Acrocarpospora macrocephala]|uniref:Glutamate mutase epsilon subunit n=1 Tax=Acrocarpospora macrocephala TaxID=150177 RepID=A0A5M3WP02_9ACTN|nr:hypothetical protein [Acrocarpospora macrocephala]GES08008.1 glutamate mutase epsilon subunit [Acrocarpospora macrocephala]
MSDQVSNEMLDLDELRAQRASVFHRQLSREPYDLDEAWDFARSNAERCGMAATLARAKSTGDTVAIPRAGVAHWDAQLELMRTLSAAGAGVVPITVDSLTRSLKFEDAAKALAQSTPDRSVLNGYPLLAHGVERTRELISSVDRPVIVRANAIDLRLVAETAFASGATGFVSGPMYATLEYSKLGSLEVSIPNWQYIFRLMGEYAAHGVPIVEDAIGFAQSGTCSVPSLMHVGVVLDALIMAGQGVKHIVPYQMLQGHVAQDVAGCLAVGTLTDEYLAKLGFGDVRTYVASSDWNGAFPSRQPDAYGLLAANVLACAIARTPVNYVKTIEEGIGVPTAAANAASIRFTRYLTHLISRQAASLISPEVQFELELNLMEARAILDAVLDMGDGDPVRGSISALAVGVLDIPFSPNVHVRGNVLPVRDADGAVRFLDRGALPLPAAALRIEAERLASRRARSGSGELSYQDVIDDLSFLEFEEPTLPEGGDPHS